MGTTAEKLAYLNTTKGLIKDSIEKMGVEVGNDTFRSYPDKITSQLEYYLSNGLEVLWNNWEKVQGTGTSLSLQNTLKGYMKVDLKGDMSQEGTPTPTSPQNIHIVSGDNTINVVGKNLFNPKSITDNYSYTYNATTGEFTGTTGKWTNYTLLEFDTPKIITFSYYGDNAQGLGYKFIYTDGTSNTTYPWNETGNYNFTSVKLVKKIESVTGTASVTSTFKIMIEANNQATTYEPYKGNTYNIDLGDIELCKINTYQDYIRKSTGVQLFDENNTTLNKYLDSNGALQTSTVSGVSDYIDVRNIDNIYINYTGTNTGLKNIGYYNENKEFQTYGTYTGATTKNVSNYSYVRLNYVMADSKLLMVSEGTTALPYEPYGKVWYLHKEIGKVVLDGTEDGWAYSSGWSKTNTNVYYATIKNDIYFPTNYNVYWLSNNLKAYSRNDLYTTDENGICFSGTTGLTNVPFTIRIDKTLASDVATFKTWLGNNNTIVYYVLATPTNTEITDTNLIKELDRIYSETGTTNITQENNDLPIELDVVALKKEMIV